MNQKAKYIVDFLKEKFPNEKIHIKYSQSKYEDNHTESLKINCDDNLDINKVIRELKSHFDGIDIYEDNNAGVILVGLNKGIIPLELITCES